MNGPGASLSRLVDVSSWSSRWPRLPLWQRRAIKTIVAVVGLIAVSSVLYRSVMITFEGESPSYSHSLQVVIETYSGTGYGSDSPWESPVANAFVSIMDLSTFLLLFIVVPYVFRPVLENALSPSVPTSVDASDHVVICGIEHQSRRLIDEFEARDVEYVVVEDEATALDLLAEDVSVIRGDPTSTKTLERACVGEARIVVVDTEDRHAASVVLAVSECDDSVRTVVLVEDLEFEPHLTYAGADRVLTPRHLLGRRIAERITSEISPTRSDSTTIGEAFSILELTVFEESPICGRTLAGVEGATDESVTALGMWREGQFVSSPPRDSVIDDDTVLLVAGRESDVRELERETYHGRDVDPTVIVAGNGIVGSTVVEELQPSDGECVVVDLEDGDGVDVIGDVTEEATLERAGVDEATIYVVAIGDDDEAILSILLADHLATDLDVIVRVNHGENETKARRAGADYVLSLPEMSGRVLAEEVLHEELLTYSRQLKPVRMCADPFVGQSIEDSQIERSNCIVVAVERDQDLVTDLPRDFEFQDGDSVLLVGSDEEVDALSE